MTRTAVIRWALGVTALALAAATVFAAVDTVSRDRQLQQAAATIGAAYEIATVRDDVARMIDHIGAAGPAAGEVAMAMSASLRGALGALIADESRRGRLEPGEIESLARVARGFDQRLSAFDAAASEGRTEAETPRFIASLTADAAVLSDIAATVRMRERAAAGALDAGLQTASLRTIQMAGAAVGLAALIGLSLAIRSAPPTAIIAENASLNRRLADAQLARARFVAMMSHELRTPMNGVLGLLSLMKDAASPEEIRRLIDQAERAGRQLTAMLGDMLDAEGAGGRREEQEAAEAATAPSTFRVDAIAESLDELFGPVAKQYGVAFRTSVKGTPPTEATGDGRRFQRALTHLCTHVVEKAGVKDVEVEISHDGDKLQAALSFEHPAGAEEAKGLAEIANAPAAETEGLGGRGLGPLLAKGLLEKMGGRLEVSTLDSGRVLILASTPSQPVEDVRPRVRVIAQTRSLGALGAAAASAAGVDVLATDKAPTPDVLLVEAGGVEEERAVAEARMQWPDAIVVALGRPDRPELFDVMVQPPLDPARVARIVAQAWAKAEQSRALPAQRAFAIRKTSVG
ncbi:MAG: sensor histidine kinase [Rhodobacteraceae bacterium]|nr:MAG: sensor histidine kinase [Paracoccaceae bacterium]